MSVFISFLEDLFGPDDPEVLEFKRIARLASIRSLIQQMKGAEEDAISLASIAGLSFIVGIASNGDKALADFQHEMEFRLSQMEHGPIELTDEQEKEVAAQMEKMSSSIRDRGLQKAQEKYKSDPMALFSAMVKMTGGGIQIPTSDGHEDGDVITIM